MVDNGILTSAMGRRCVDFTISKQGEETGISVIAGDPLILVCCRR